MAAKPDLRSQMRTMLRSINANERLTRSAAAVRHLLASAVWRDARVVFTFLSLPHEVDTTGIVEAAWAERRRVLVPRIDPSTSTMIPIEITSWSDCLPGFRGILEPVGKDAVAPRTIDLVLVPGLAFDLAGGRLGQGGGYYDRFLAAPEVRALTCGLCFQGQVVEVVPTESHDRRMDFLVTDLRLRRCAKS